MSPLWLGLLLSALLTGRALGLPPPSRLPLTLTIENDRLEVAGAAIRFSDSPGDTPYAEVLLTDVAHGCGDAPNDAVRDLGFIVYLGPRGELPRGIWLKTGVNLQGLRQHTYGALRPQHARVRFSNVRSGVLRVEFEFDDDYERTSWDGIRAEAHMVSKGRGVIDAPLCRPPRDGVPPERDATVSGPLTVRADGKSFTVSTVIAQVDRFANDTRIAKLSFFGRPNVQCAGAPEDELFDVYEPAYACEHGTLPGPQHAQWSAGPRLSGLGSDKQWHELRVRQWVELTEAKLEPDGVVRGKLSIVDAKGRLTVQGEFSAKVCFER